MIETSKSTAQGRRERGIFFKNLEYISYTDSISWSYFKLFNHYPSYEAGGMYAF